MPGKSTLFSIMTGLTCQSGGKAYINGYNIFRNRSKVYIKREGYCINPPISY